MSPSQQGRTTVGRSLAKPILINGLPVGSLRDLWTGGTGTTGADGDATALGAGLGAAGFGAAAGGVDLGGAALGGRDFGSTVFGGALCGVALPGAGWRVRGCGVWPAQATASRVASAKRNARLTRRTPPSEPGPPRCRPEPSRRRRPEGRPRAAPS